MKRTWLGAASGATWGLVSAVVIAEASGMTAFSSAFGHGVCAVAISVSLGATSGALLSLPWARRLSIAKLSSLGALFGGLSTLLFLRNATAWIDLSVFGAGPAGELVFLTIPLAQLVAGAVVGSLLEPQRTA
jgi:hypothetical protein